MLMRCASLRTCTFSSASDGNIDDTAIDEAYMVMRVVGLHQMVYGVRLMRRGRLCGYDSCR
jgi:hypothetical protein